LKKKEIYASTPYYLCMISVPSPYQLRIRFVSTPYYLRIKAVRIDTEQVRTWYGAGY